MTAEAPATLPVTALDQHLLWTPAAGRSPIPAALLPRTTGPAHVLVWEAGAAPGHWHARLNLPTLAAGSLLVPSLVEAIGGGLRGYRIELRWPGGGRLPLAPVLLDAALDETWPVATTRAIEADGRRVLGGLDCIETGTALADAQLHVEAVTDGPEPRVAMLVGYRPRHANCPDDGGVAPALDLPAHSQMTRSAELARHVCSPVSVAMVLGRLGIDVDPEAFARSVEHPHHRHLFGMWPLNLARAHALGAAGLVRVFGSAREAADLLAAGHALVASIRFEAGALPGAPLPRTGGHLVVLRGMGPDRVQVHDPAAPDDTSVARDYDRAAFLKAWLADRGVGYVLWRPEPGA